MTILAILAIGLLALFALACAIIAARLWHVTDRHARRVIAESGAGFRVGRAWLVRRAFAERHTPRPPGRPKQQA